MTHLAIHGDSDDDNEPITTRTKSLLKSFKICHWEKTITSLSCFQTFDEATFNLMVAMTQLFLIVQKELGVEMMKCEQWIVSVV